MLLVHATAMSQRVKLCQEDKQVSGFKDNYLLGEGFDNNRRGNDDAVTISQ